MVRPHLVRRAVRLLGAVAVTGALSAGAVATSTAAAETPSSFEYGGVYAASGRQHVQANGLDKRWFFKVLQANGL